MKRRSECSKKKARECVVNGLGWVLRGGKEGGESRTLTVLVLGAMEGEKGGCCLIQWKAWWRGGGAVAGWVSGGESSHLWQLAM